MTAADNITSAELDLEPVADVDPMRELRLRVWRLERRVAAVERDLEQLRADLSFVVPTRRRRWWFGGGR